MLAPPRTDPASFRDPLGRVLHADNRIYRVLSPQGRAWLSQVWDSGIVARLTEAGFLIETRRVADSDATYALLDSDGVAVLEHERLPLVSYPYEWTFAGLKKAALLHLDTSRPEAPKARSFSEEIARVVRGRLTNPRWLSGMLEHGHRGVAEIAQTVDALYAFSATAGVPVHLFDATHAALIADDAVRTAMLQKNPAAAAAIAARLHDALARGLWITRRNAVDHDLQRLISEAGR